jgi:hypothetical protein
MNSIVSFFLDLFLMKFPTQITSYSSLLSDRLKGIQWQGPGVRANKDEEFLKKKFQSKVNV